MQQRLFAVVCFCRTFGYQVSSVTEKLSGEREKRNKEKYQVRGFQVRILQIQSSPWNTVCQTSMLCMIMLDCTLIFRIQKTKSENGISFIENARYFWL